MPKSTKAPWLGSVWQRVRLEILKRDHYLCQVKGPRCTKVATCVDHICKPQDGGSWVRGRQSAGGLSALQRVCAVSLCAARGSWGCQATKPRLVRTVLGVTHVTQTGSCKWRAGFHSEYVP
jgi:hypothetical protein